MIDDAVNFISNLNKISLNKIVSTGMMIWGNLIAPFWFIFQFAPNVYRENAFINLCVLSLAIGIPVSFLFFTSLIAGMEINKYQLRDRLLMSLCAQASFATAVTLYTPCVLTFGLQLNIKTAIIIASMLGIFGWTVFYFETRRIKKKQALDTSIK